MVDIRHRVGIEAPLSEVFGAIATREGLEGWWVPKVEGRTDSGGRLTFYNAGPSPMVVMEVVEVEPDERVVWRCLDGPDEWKETTVTFDLSISGDEAVVLFTHAGWREPVEFLHHCSTKWAYYLLGLKARLEGLTGSPWADDVKGRWG